MGRSRVIDPLTCDYVRAGGGRATTLTIATKLHHTFRAHRGVWAGDPDRGCNLHRVARGNINAGTRAAVDNELRAAVQPYLDEGLAKDFRLVVDVTSVVGRVLTDSSITDVQAGLVDLGDLTRFTE